MVCEIREFIYRRPRLRTDIPVLVRLTPVYSIPGRCLDVSTEGIGVRLEGAPPPDTMVVLEFVLCGKPFQIEARLQHRAAKTITGSRFSFPQNWSGIPCRNRFAQSRNLRSDAA